MHNGVLGVPNTCVITSISLCREIKWWHLMLCLNLMMVDLAWFYSRSLEGRQSCLSFHPTRARHFKLPFDYAHLAVRVRGPRSTHEVSTQEAH
jgi:hypothetical protein